MRYKRTAAAAPVLRWNSVKNAPRKTFADVDAAFKSGRVLHCSKQELEQLLVAAGGEGPSDPVLQARVRETSETMRQLLDAKTRPQHSNLALLATAVAVVALLGSAAQALIGWRAYSAVNQSAAEMSDYIRATNRDDAWEGDARLQASIAELARRAPSLDKGTLQAWWAGEQARQVQALEATAKRQTLAGDREGAALSARRADAIRSGIDVLATFERPHRN